MIEIESQIQKFDEMEKKFLQTGDQFDPIKKEGMILAVGAPPGKSISKINFRPKSSLTPVKSVFPMQIE